MRIVEYRQAALRLAIAAGLAAALSACENREPSKGGASADPPEGAS